MITAWKSSPITMSPIFTAGNSGMTTSVRPERPSLRYLYRFEPSRDTRPLNLHVHPMAGVETLEQFLGDQPDGVLSADPEHHHVGLRGLLRLGPGAAGHDVRVVASPGRVVLLAGHHGGRGARAESQPIDRAVGEIQDHGHDGDGREDENEGIGAEGRHGLHRLAHATCTSILRIWGNQSRPGYGTAPRHTRST